MTLRNKRYLLCASICVFSVICTISLKEITRGDVLFWLPIFFGSFGIVGSSVLYILKLSRTKQ